MQIKLRMQRENFNWSETKWTEDRKKKDETPKPKPETSEASAASQQHISAPFEYLFKFSIFSIRSKQAGRSGSTETRNEW